MRPSDYELVEPRFRRALCVIDALGAATWGLRGLFAPRRRIDPDEIRRILVLGTYGLGDAILATGCWRALRDRFPNAIIDAMSSPRSDVLVRMLPYFDSVTIFDNPVYRVRESKPGNWAAARSAIRALRARRYDLCLDVIGDLPNCALAAATGARIRIAHPTMGGGFFLTHPVARDTANTHQRAILAETLAPLGIDARAHSMELPVSEADLAEAHHVIAERIDGPWAAISPGALTSAKTWPAERFAALAARLKERFGWSSILLGAPSEKDLGTRIADASHGAAVSLCGELALGTVFGAIAQARVFVGNDSGLTHAAVALDVPAVQLFGPGLPDRFGHRDARREILFDNDCRFHPCSTFRCKVPDAWCMERLHVDAAADAVARVTGAA
ncbi:MAG: glycosyltransferase family 9 protein [Deltaproteobacteria bacterium]|nr:glycosyltransferase family 9 protein [Deltaproteobacteria bacterium]